LIVTGGAVRLTGSGLGCPTWPTCTGSSYTPVPHQAQGALHSWIEFGNRLLTFLLFAAALAAIVTTFTTLKRRGDVKAIRRGALLQLLGILGQGVLGGITVLTKLNPLPVAGHFLLSIVLVAGAVALRFRVLERPHYLPTPLTSILTRSTIALTAAILVVGTVVTGSGPHAGDIQAKRFPYDAAKVAIFHSDLVIALTCLIIALLLIIRINESGSTQRAFYRAVGLFLFVCLAQGLIGYVQYFTGLPELLVGVHLFGSTLVWISACNIALIGRVYKRRDSVITQEA
jgi:cytochrome c oxidase assembly protein subunit 15